MIYNLLLYYVLQIYEKVRLNKLKREKKWKRIKN